MTTTPSLPLSSRALVLGGGGGAGNAWEIGVIAGLAAGGVDVSDADLIVGTSAGSTAAAQISSAAPDVLFETTVDTSPPGTGARTAHVGPRVADATVADMIRVTGDIISTASDPADMRRRLGATALASDAAAEATAPGAATARWRATVAARLPQPHWPEQRILVVAVDAASGEPVVFDRDSGVDLVDAVAASCSQGFGSFPPYRIGDIRYIDGGYRSPENADLAAGERVLVLAPLGGRTRHPLHWGTHLAAQVDGLRAGGSEVETVVPDAASLTAFGDNLMDPSNRPPAARAGYAQGQALAERLAVFWG